MANRYGEAALRAARMETFGKALTPGERWDAAMLELYPTTPAARKKAGPRGAFLGLAEAGLIRGVEAGHPGSANRNKSFAVSAVELLRAGTHTTVTQLWRAITEGEDVEHGAQMDVVLALWKNKLIV